jgi:predicted nucleic acid-binding protein
MTEVCVDASLVVKLVSEEPDSASVDALFAGWHEQGVRLIAPSFLPAEVDSILQQKVVRRRELTPEQAHACFTAALQIPVELLSFPGQRELAWLLAEELRLPHVYDATYMALAELRGCEFWTADRRLVNTCEHLPFVRCLGESGYIGQGEEPGEQPHAPA